MITFNDIIQCLNADLRGISCIEIEFCIDGYDQFYECWMGKMPNEHTKEDIFWFGLTPDGKNAYDYSDFKQMSTDKVLKAKVWKKYGIRLRFYPLTAVIQMNV